MDGARETSVITAGDDKTDLGNAIQCMGAERVTSDGDAVGGLCLVLIVNSTSRHQQYPVCFQAKCLFKVVYSKVW